MVVVVVEVSAIVLLEVVVAPAGSSAVGRSKRRYISSSNCYHFNNAKYILKNLGLSLPASCPLVSRGC